MTKCMQRGAAIVAASLLVTVTSASAELTVQGWLDFYDGKTRTPAVVSQLMAETYVLGVADSAISLRVLSCPKGYIPKAENIAKQTAMVLRDNHNEPAISVTAAVLMALTIDAGCELGPRGTR